jgi:HEAT repeat protein
MRACIDNGASNPSEEMELTRAYLQLVAPDSAYEAAHELLHHDSSFVRDAASDALLDLPAAAGFAVLTRLRDDEDRDVRWYVYEAVASAVTPWDPRAENAVPMLAGGLRDEDFSIRWVASNGLLRIGARAVVPVLEEIARGEASATFHEAARRVLSRVDASPELAAEIAALVDSLGRGTTVVQSRPLAADILDRLAGSRGAS